MHLVSFFEVQIYANTKHGIRFLLGVKKKEIKPKYIVQKRMYGN